MYYGYTKYKTNENGYTKSKENEKLDIFLSSFFDSYSREKRPKSDDELIEKIQKDRKIIESEIKNNNKRYNKQQYQNALDMLDKFSKILKGDIQTEKGVNDYIDNDRSHDKVNNFLIYNFIKSGIEVVGNFFVNKTDKQEGIELLIQPQSKYEAQSSDFKSDYTGLTDGEKSPSIGVIRNDAKSQDVLSDPKMM